MNSIQILQATGLGVAKYNEMMAQSGILCGFILTFTLLLFISQIK
ncbi:hypothetical protein [Campylobacter ureolyticus]|nr:hypothetical protein [Campylobacter ureolyticus]MCR8700322.1 hypothetical protein [Campylobacter ureolyticus]